MIVWRLQWRVLILVVAFGIGLIAQVSAVAAMSLPDAGQGAMSMPGAHHCHDCGDHESTAKLIMPSCVSGFFCSIAPAILGDGSAPLPMVHATFSLSPSQTARGITVMPDLGPPRPTAAL